MKPIKMSSFFLLVAVILAACGSIGTQISTKGVSDEINGQANPTLSAEPGQTITVILINGGEGQHDITFPAVKASTGVVKAKGEETSVTFTLPNADGELEYFDSVGNHADLGMRGKLLNNLPNNRLILLCKMQSILIRPMFLPRFKRVLVGPAIRFPVFPTQKVSSARI
jgi:plastocyanin